MKRAISVAVARDVPVRATPNAFGFGAAVLCQLPILAHPRGMVDPRPAGRPWECRWVEARGAGAEQQTRSR